MTQPRPNDKRTAYFNVGTGRHTETIDQFDAADYETDRAWRHAMDKARREYWRVSQYPNAHVRGGEI